MTGSPHLHQPVEAHEVGVTHRKGFIHPVTDWAMKDWDKAGRLEVGGRGGTMHRAALSSVW